MYFLGRHDSTSWAVDSQNNGFDGGIVGKTLQFDDRGLRIHNDTFNTN